MDGANEHSGQLHIDSPILINRIDQPGGFYERTFPAAPGMLQSVGRTLSLYLLIVLAYYLSTKIAFALCLPDSKIPLAFPPYAVLIAALLFLPLRHWLGSILAAICGHHLAAWQAQWPFWYALHYDVFNVVQCVTAAAGIRLLAKAPLRYATFREAFLVITVAAIVVPFATSFWGAAFITSSGYGVSYWIEWRNLWLSNAVAAMAILPGFIVIIANASNWRRHVGWKRVAEAMLLGTVLLATCIFVFASQFDSFDVSSGLLYVPIPLLVWAGLRFGPGGSSASLLLVWALAIWGAMHGRGPVVAHSPTHNTLSLQYYFLMISVPLTLLAVITREVEQSQTALRESEDRFRVMADTAPVMIWKSGIDKRFTFFNKGWLEFIGRAPASASDLVKTIHPADRERWAQIYGSSFDARQSFTMEYRLQREDGEYRWIIDNGVPRFDSADTFLGYIGSAVDITERKQAELKILQQRSELAHLSRVTMLGELSGSLAHELNQPLTAILSNAQAAQRFLAHETVDLNEVRAILSDIVDADRRAGEVIRRLRLLLKKGEVNQQPVEVNEVVRDVLKLVNSDLMNQEVTVVAELDPELPAINADRVQLQQVLLNLIMNGCEAMALVPKAHRRLRVRTEIVRGVEVHISVSDQGSGILPSQLETIFSPFFTSKPHGMGLGLTVCQTIVSAHGGRLWAVNSNTGGATFYVSLPAIAPDALATMQIPSTSAV